MDKELQHLLQWSSRNNDKGLLQVSTGERKRIGGPRLYCSLSTSPDAQYLLVAWLERPFSYNVPCGRFPKRIQVWDRSVPEKLYKAKAVSGNERGGGRGIRHGAPG